MTRRGGKVGEGDGSGGKGRERGVGCGAQRPRTGKRRAVYCAGKCARVNRHVGLGQAC